MLESVATQSTRSPVIEVNGERIYADEIRTRMSAMRAQAEASGQELSVEERLELRPAAIRDLVDRLLMQQEARRLKLTPSAAEIDAALESVAPKYDGSAGCRADAANEESRDDISARLMLDRLLASWLDAVRPPKIQEVREFYRKNQELFVTEELIAASHIVKHFEEGADPANAPCPPALEEVRASILNGEDFVEAAKRFSDCPENGGSLGYFPRGVMVPEFEEVAFAAKIAEVSAPFRTQFGWHIALVWDRKPAGVRTLDEVASQIQERLLREKQEQQVDQKLNALRTKASYIELGRV